MQGAKCNPRGLQIQAQGLHHQSSRKENNFTQRTSPSERGPATFFRYRPKGVLGKGVGNNKNASEMHQKCAKMGLVLLSGSVRVRFLVRFPAVKVPIFGGFPVENPTNKKQPPQSSSKGNFFVRVRFGGVPRLSEYGSVACLVERPTRETQAEQYSDNGPVLGKEERSKMRQNARNTFGEEHLLSRTAKGGRQGGRRQFKHGSCFCSGLATFAQCLINIEQAGFCTFS